jgi:hypothetical protein
MGRGRRRVKTSTTTVAVATRTPEREPSGGAEVNGGGQSDQSSALCWTFLLEEPERETIREVRVGESVLGQPISGRVLVTSSQRGVLGRAPAGYSRKMIEAQLGKGGSLTGEVIEHRKTTVKVRLCLHY